MSICDYELIEHRYPTEAKIFFTSVASSSFHWHYDYEIMLVLHGKVTVFHGENINDMEQGDVVLFNSKVIHGLQATTEKNICMFIQIPKALLTRGLKDEQSYYFYFNSIDKRHLPEKPYEYFVKFLSKIGLESIKKGISDEFRKQAMIYELIALMLENIQYDIRMYPKNNQVDENNQLMERIFKYIEENVGNDLISEEIYNKVGIGKKTLYRFLKSNLGLTFKQLIDINRIERSKRLLKENKKSISCITNECGFTNESTFYRVFKKELGVTPKEYQEHGTKTVLNRKIQNYVNCDMKQTIEMLHYFINLKEV